MAKQVNFLFEISSNIGLINDHDPNFSQMFSVLYPEVCGMKRALILKFTYL